MIDFDKILPRWTPTKVLPEKDRALTPYNTYNGPRTLAVQDEDGLVEERVVPYARYLRAVDLSGNVIALVVSTNRVDAYDGTDYETKLTQRKRKAGWLFVDDPPYGMSDLQWQEKLDEEVKNRRMKHEAKERAHASSYRTHHQALLEANREALEDVMRTMFKEMRVAGIVKKVVAKEE